MNDIASSSSDLLFRANQIICLEHNQNCLFGEVIQLVPERGLCWFRPICIVELGDNSCTVTTDSQIVNLQSGSDLLWPTTLFRYALDTEVISVIGRLNNNKSSTSKSNGRQRLNKFVQEVWQANKDKF